MKEAFEIFTDLPGQLSKLPTAGVIALVIVAVGMAVKRTRWIPNRFIPLIALAIGGSLYSFMGKPGAISPDLPHPQLVLMLYGFLIGFGAWAAHVFVLKRFEKYIPGLTASMEGDSDPKAFVKPVEPKEIKP